MFRRILTQSLWLAAVIAVPTLWAAPFKPANDEVILERVRRGAPDAETIELRKLREAALRRPGELEPAVALAQRFIHKSRSTSDPRYLSYAEAALATWWKLPEPPGPVLVLRATIRQSVHQFDPALADLDLLLKRDPGNAQAWLTRATILQVQGHYAAARQSCVPLFQLANQLVALTSAANVASLNGDAERSYLLLRATLEKEPRVSAGERQWALTALAEMAVRLGKIAEAEKYFREALRSDRDPYLIAAWADFLFDQQRYAEVEERLKPETQLDGLLLRLARAEQKLNRPVLDQHLQMLRDRFEASALRGDTVHRREEAMLRLHLLKQPAAALRLATENWTVQKEPADARILLEAALASRDFAAAKPVLEFLESTRLEDVTLHRLAASCRELTKGTHGSAH